MFNVLKYSKIIKNGSVWWPFGCGYFFNLLMFSTVPIKLSETGERLYKVYKVSNNIVQRALFMTLSANRLINEGQLSYSNGHY